MEVNKYNIHEEGMKRFYGPLEAQIMDDLWTYGESSIKEVQERLSKENHRS